MKIEEYTMSNGSKRYLLKGAYIGTDKVTGKQIRKELTGKSKKEVELKLARAKVKFENAGCTIHTLSTKTFEDVVNSWFDLYKTTVKAHSVQQMNCQLKAYILPPFRNIKISKITAALIQAEVNKWARHANEPLNGKRKRPNGKGRDFKLYLDIYDRIFKYSLALDLIDRNPCDKVIIPKVKVQKTEKAIKHLTREELQTFFAYLDTLPKGDYLSELMTCLCRLLVSSGLRINEALALYWEDIDFEKNTVTVSKTLVFRKIQDTPKTRSSNRVIIIDRKAIIALQRWKLFLGSRHKKLIFPDPAGRISNDSTLRNFLIRCFDACDLPNIGFHGFRHTHASLLLSAGAGYKEIQQRLGHASIKMTMDIYSHLAQDKQEQTIELYEKYATF